MPNISNPQTSSSKVAYAVPEAVTEPEARTVSKSGLVELLARPGLAWIVLSVLTLLTWGPRLLRSFWVDEAGTFWMVYKGPIAAIQRTWHWPGQSVLYSVIASFFCLNSGPLRELLLRIPTVVGMFVAAYYLYRFAESAIGKGAGYIAVILFALNPVTVSMGTQARPYGLAMGAVAASSWALYRWVETRSKRDLIAYAIASTLIIYLHYLFVGVFFVHILYLLFVFVVERRLARWQWVAAAYLCIGLISVPLIPHMMLLVREGRTLPFMSLPPAPEELIAFILHPILAFGMFIAAFLIALIFTDQVKQPLPLQRSTLVFLLTWLLLIPVLFFAVSRVSPLKIFVPRYISFSVEAESLMLAALGYTVFSAWPGRLWAVVAVLLSTASPAAIKHALNVGMEDLKPFMGIVAAHSKEAGSPPPVFFRSELPESTYNDWRSGLHGDGHLYAPFVAYPMPNRLLPLPFHFTEAAKKYISETIDSQLLNEPEVIFVTHDNKWDAWMINRMKQAGFVASSIEQPNAFTVITFKKASQPSATHSAKG